ncbi:hypothetical protein R0137_00075 [Congregibacter brevis]|uniref:Uncharacterized protein n=1 Tax=Congregibacter brevis TaxID=3081201 RepID=A0ABZ0IBT1_9GAMM|nr:hypothetical protein R0137_00075 [Congregibacter sp. IMCC45268]
MSEIRERAREHFPSVMLTLLSIVQALALELLWARLHENTLPVELTWPAVTAWIQVAATVLGLMLIWVVYASNAMRFRWVPSTSDSLYPFFIGFMQFLLIDCMTPSRVGWWLICMAVIFSVMVWVSHSTMRRARFDGSNDEYFRHFSPAGRKDFFPQIALIATFLIGGAYLVMRPEQLVAAFSMMLIVLIVLAWQLYAAAHFWNKSIEVKPDA